MKTLDITVEESYRRIHVAKEHLEKNIFPHERTMWIGIYANNLMYVKDQIGGYLDITRYVETALWFNEHTTPKERAIHYTTKKKA